MTVFDGLVLSVVLFFACLCLFLFVVVCGVLVCFVLLCVLFVCCCRYMLSLLFVVVACLLCCFDVVRC